LYVDFLRPFADGQLEIDWFRKKLEG